MLPYIFFINFFIVFLVTEESIASCVCKCVKGKPIPICEEKIKIKPICSPRVCGDIDLENFDKIIVPTIGKKKKFVECNHKKVSKKNSQVTQWTEICE